MSVPKEDVITYFISLNRIKYTFLSLYEAEQSRGSRAKAGVNGEVRLAGFCSSGSIPPSRERTGHI